MPANPTKSGLAAADRARIYYEMAGEGQPVVMIHAGVADSRQWNNEFEYFSTHADPRWRAIRYDMRGYGRSEPVAGEFSHLQDLTALLDHLKIDQPVILIGCSMGGGLALDFALTYPARTKALILVGSGPTGLKLDVPPLPKFEEAEQAYQAGDLDRVAEIETQIWFDGMERSPEQVNPAMRKLAYAMNRLALEHEAKHLGKRLADTQVPAASRLGLLDVPVLILVGDQDNPYLHAASDYMLEKIRSARKAIINDAAHLANMDQPAEFQRLVTEFLAEVG